MMLMRLVCPQQWVCCFNSSIFFLNLYTYMLTSYNFNSLLPTGYLLLLLITRDYGTALSLWIWIYSPLYCPELSNCDWLLSKGVILTDSGPWVKCVTHWSVIIHVAYYLYFLLFCVTQAAFARVYVVTQLHKLLLYPDAETNKVPHVVCICLHWGFEYILLGVINALLL